MSTLAYTYLFLCGFIAGWMIVMFIKEDIYYHRHPYSGRKFPPNYKCPLAWVMMLAVSCPVLNLVVLMAWIVMGIDHWRAKHVAPARN